MLIFEFYVTVVRVGKEEEGEKQARKEGRKVGRREGVEKMV